MTCKECESSIDPKAHVKAVEDLGDSIEIRYTCPDCESTFYAFIGKDDWQPLE